MTSLTKIAIITRKIIRYTFFGIIAIILARSAILTSIRIYRYYHPLPPPAPTVSFGKLPTLPFPEKDRPTDLMLTLQTPDGEFPNLPDQVKVYFMPKLSPNLLSLDSAKEKAKKLGFQPDGEEITETVYKFHHDKVPSELKININTGVFSISYNLAEDKSPLEELPPAPEVAASNARSYLSTAGLLSEDLSGPTTPEFVKVEEDKIVGALSLSEANFVRINLFRKSFDDLPSLTPDPDIANVWLMISGSRKRESQFIAAEYHYFPVEEGSFATYPIKTPVTAWEEFKGGNGYIASLGTNNDNNIVIRRVYLAYYDPGSPTEFYQPIYAFEGDKGFIGYLPAVTPDYYGE